MEIAVNLSGETNSKLNLIHCLGMVHGLIYTFRTSLVHISSGVDRQTPEAMRKLLLHHLDLLT